MCVGGGWGVEWVDSVYTFKIELTEFPELDVGCEDKEESRMNARSIVCCLQIWKIAGAINYYGWGMSVE